MKEIQRRNGAVLGGWVPTWQQVDRANELVFLVRGGQISQLKAIAILRKEFDFPTLYIPSAMIFERMGIKMIDQVS